MPRDERRPLPRRAARTRMLLKAPLGWLGGFPLRLDGGGVRWWTPPGAAAQPAVLGARELRRASRALLEIRGELRDTLPEVVADLERWLTATADLLDAVGAMVHHRARQTEVRPPAQRETTALDELRRRQRCLAPLVDAVHWSLWTAPWQARRTVRWLDDHADELASLFAPELRPALGCEPVELAMTVVAGAASDGIDDAGAFLRALGHPDLDSHSHARLATRHAALLQPSNKSVKALAKGKLGAPPQPLPSRRSLAAFVGEWAAWERSRRRTAARLWHLVFDADLFTAWGRWWREVAEIQGQLSRFAELQRTLADPARFLTRLEKRLLGLIGERSRPGMPSSFAVTEMLDALRVLSADAELARAGGRAVETLPEEYQDLPTRAAFVRHWKDLCAEHPAPRLAGHLDAFRRLVARGGAQALAPWAPLLSDAYRGEIAGYSPDDFCLEWPDPPALDSAPMVRAALALGALDAERRRLALCLCLAGAPADLAAAAAARDFEFHPDELADPYHAEALREAVVLAPDAESLGRVLGRMGKLRQSESAGLLLRGARCLGERHAWAAVELIDRDPGTLVDLGRRLRVAEALGGSAADGNPVPNGESDRSWIDAYPEPLQDDLQALAAADPDAEATARSVLRREIRHPASLERERAAVAARAARCADQDERRQLEARRDKLDAWLQRPPALAPRQLARLQPKLRRAACAAALARRRAAADAALRDAFAALARRLAVPADPGTLTDPASYDLLLEAENLQLVDAVIDLAQAARRFGLQLLLRRCGPPPWHLHEHPDNLEFRRRMTAAGVDLSQWLDGTFRRDVTDAKGRRLTIEIERDPLQVLRMGAPFGTCLSPWDFNFFSAVSNAAGADKQVVFARDEEGRIFGRCLLALGTTAEGSDALIAFYPYCHDSEAGFRGVMSEYAGELGRVLGVPLATGGRVGRLVCPDWYDDGPFDLRGDLEFLADGSPFHASLAEIEPDELAETLVAAAPRPVDAHLVASLLPLLRPRPGLVVGLAQWIERLRLPAVDRLRAAALARQAGRDDLARRWVGQCAGHLRELDENGFPWWDRPLGETLADLQPSLVLGLLRETRARSVRSWRAEQDVYRLYVAARAHLALHRRRKARELFQRVAEGQYHYDRSICAKAQRAIERLDRRE